MQSVRPGFNHASCVAINGAGLLIVGESGVGKSELAIALIALGADLVGDDQVEIIKEDDEVIIKRVSTQIGKIEARYIGVLSLKSIPKVGLNLIVDMSAKPTNRLPELETTSLFEKNIPIIAGGNVPNLANALYLMLRNQT